MPDDNGVNTSPVGSLDISAAEVGSDPSALSSYDPTPSSQFYGSSTRPDNKPNLLVRLVKRADVILAVLLVLSMLGIFFVTSSDKDNKNNNGLANSSLSTNGRYETQNIPLGDFANSASGINIAASSVVVNGLAELNRGLIVSPSSQPSTPKAGQIYYDKDINQLAYYNGQGFIPIGTGVTSVQGLTGSVTLTAGNGIAINGTTISSTVSGGTGTVTSPGGTAGRLAKFTGVQAIGDSLLSESGAVVTVAGDLNVTNALTLGTALSVANGGTGAATLAANGVLIGNGTGAVTSVTAGAPGQCLLSTAGAPAFAACPGGGGGVSSLNGQTGIVNIANASGAAGTVTINDATTAAKGIASFNSTNFSVAAGAVNTIQNINTGATPTFAGVNTNSITPSGALTIGSTTQSLTLQGNGSTVLTATGGGFTTTVGFSGVPSGAVRYDFDRSAAAGTYTLCSTAGNCAGVGGGVTTPGGTNNTVAIFTGSQTLGNSIITQSGTTINIAGSLTLNNALGVGYGGTGTTSTPTNGQLLIGNGTGYTLAGLTNNGGITVTNGAGSIGLAVNYGSLANTAVQGNTVLNCPSGTGNLTGGGTAVTLGSGGSCASLNTVNNPTFTTSVTTPIIQNAGLTLAATGANSLQLQTNGNTRLTIASGGDLTATGSATLQGGGLTLGTNSQPGSVVLSDGSSSTGTIQTAALGQNTIYTLPDPGGASVSICLTTGNCAGVGGGITGSGTNGTIAKFTGTGTVGDSIITDNGSTATIGGTLAVNTISPTGAFTVGVNGQTTAVQGSVTTIASSGAGNNIILNSANTIELQDSTNITGNLDVSGTLTAGTGNAFQVDASGNVTAGTYNSNTFTSSNLQFGAAATATIQSAASQALTITANAASTWSTSTGNLTVQAASDLNLKATSGNVVIGTSDGAGTLLVVDTKTSAGDPSGVDGSIYYNSNSGSFRCFQGGAWTDCITASGGFVSLQNAYDNGNAISTDATGDIAFTLNNQNFTIATAAGASGSTTFSLTDGGNPSAPSQLVLITNNDINQALAAGLKITSAAGGITTALDVSGGNITNAIDVGSNKILGASAVIDFTNFDVASNGEITSANNATLQGGSVTIGTSSLAGSVILYDGSSSTGTIQTAALGQNTIYTLPDPGSGTVSICLTTGNCAGAGGGITGSGTTDQLAKFTAGGVIGDSTISDDGSIVTTSVNMLVQGGNLTVGTTSQTASFVLHDGNGQTTTLQAGDSVGTDLTFILPTTAGSANQCLKQSGVGNQLIWDACDGGGGGTSGTLQDAYDNSTNPELVVDATRGALTVRDNATPIGANLLEVQNNGGGTTYLAVSAAGTTVTAGLTVSGGLTVSSGGASITGNTTIATTAGNTLSLGNSTGALTVTGNSSSTFVINGITVDATEFNRLDGKDAALVDTNDAVSTAITGTGALNSGSITSGFGSIDTGADNITTTGTLQGTTAVLTQSLDRTSAGALNIGASTATSIVLGQSTSLTGAATFTSGTGTVLLQGNTDIAASVSLATKRGATYTTPGSANNVTLNVASLYILDTSGAAQTITGIAAGRDGQHLTLVNADASSSVTLSNLNGSSSASNQISTGVGADVSIAPGASIDLVYDTASNLWRLVGGTAGGAGTCPTCANQQLSNLSSVNLNTALNATSANLNLTTTTSGNIVLNSAGTIELQDSTNVTGALTSSSTLTVTAGGLTVSAGGASVAGNTTIATSAGNTLGLGNSTGTLTVTGNSSSIFVLNGVTVDATEFNRLDGKDAALVDTNDAVSTAITGTGTLTSGALGSGFTTVAVGQGGTGATSFTANGVLYGNNTGAIGVTAAGTTGQCLVGNTGSAPTWSSCAGLITLQNAYANGSTISTTGNDIGFTLNSGQDFTVASTDSGSSAIFSSNQTTGTVLSLANSTAGQTSARLLDISSSGYTTGYTGNVVNISGTSTTGAGNLVNIVNNGLNGAGTALNVNSSSTGAFTNGLAMFNGSATHTGSVVNIQSASTTGTALNIGASALTSGSALNINAGTGKALNVTSGLSVLTAPTSGSGDTLSVSNSTSTGNIAIFKDNSTAVFTIADGGDALFRSETSSATAFRIQGITGTETLLTADTTVRTLGVNGNRIKIGNSAGNDTDVTILQVDSASLAGVPATGLSLLNGGLLYNTGTNRLNFIENSGITSYLHQNAADTSSAAITASNFLYGFMNSSSAVASGVLKLDNGTNTNSTLTVTASGNPSSGQALIFASNTNASPSGNLIDLQSGSSPTSKFSVTAAGNVLTAGTSYTGTGALTVSSGGSGDLTLDSASGRAKIAVGDFLNTSVAGVSGAAAGDIWYDSSAGKYKINEGGSTKIICNMTDLGCGAGATTPLQTAYNDDVDGGDATISLTTADDSLVFTNPNNVNSTDSAFLLQLNQAHTTNAVKALDIIQASNAANAVNITANSIDTENALSISATALTTGFGIDVTTDGSVTSGGGLRLTATNAPTFSAGNGLLQVVGNGAYTGQLATISSSGTTTGSLLNLALSNASQTTATALNVTQSGVTTGYTGNFVSFTGSSTTGTGNLLQLTSVNTTNGNALNVTSNSLTTGKAVTISSSAAAQTTATLLTVTQSGTTTGFTGNTVAFTGSSTTGTGNLLQLTSVNTTNGNALNVTSNSLTTGNAVNINSTASGLTTGSLLRISSSTTGLVDTNGIVSIQASGNYTSNANNGLLNVLAANTTAGTIANIQGGSLTSGVALNIAANTGTAIRVSSGLTTLTAPTSGSGDTLSVSNSTSTGNIAIFKDNATTVATIADGGAATFQNATNSPNGFRILNSGNGELLGTDTTSSIIRLLNNYTGAIVTGGWATLSGAGHDLPSSRFSHGSATYNGYVYVVGGNDSSDVAQTTIYYARFNADGSIGAWASTTALPEAREEMSTVAVNGYLYAIGGRGPSNAFRDTVLYAKINADGTVGTWNSTSTLLTARTNQTSVTANGYVYVMGGTEQGGPIDDVDYARLNSDGTLGTWTSTTPMATPRYLHASAAANGYVYIISGSDGSNVTTVSKAKLNTDGTVGSWSNTTALPDDRILGSAAVVNGYLYHMGGDGSLASGSYLRTYYAPLNADGTIGSWTQTADMNTGRRKATAVTSNGYIYEIGGENGFAIAGQEYASPARVTIGGSLDLVNQSGENLAEGSSAGSLTAGNTNIAGLLSVTGTATFRDSVTVGNNLTVQSQNGSTSAFAVMNGSAVPLFSVDSTNSRVYVGNPTADTTGTFLVLDAKTTSGDPTGVNGAIYYSSGGQGGADGGTSFSGKFRCFEGSIWKNCIGMRDIVERRWGYAAPAGLAATSLTKFGNLGATTATGGAADTSNSESFYVKYTTAATTNDFKGEDFSGTTATAQWKPKLVARVRVDASAVTTTRDWIALTSTSLNASDGTGSYIGLRYSTAAGDTAWQCASRDGVTASVTTTGVTVTAGHYYDIIVDLSTAGTLVCSVADNGGAYTTVTKTTNLPAAGTTLGLEMTVTALANAARSLSAAYAYVEQN